MKKMLLFVLSLSFNVIYPMQEIALENALHILTEKLDSLHSVLTQKALRSKKSKEPAKNFNKAINDAQQFLTNFREKIAVFKNKLNVFICFVRSAPERIQLNEPAQFKELIYEKDSLPSIEEIELAINSLDQFVNTPEDINTTVKFLNQFKDFLNDIVNYTKKITRNNIDLFGQRTMTFNGHAKTIDQHFSDIISYFNDIKENVINDALSKALDSWNEKL